MLAKCKSFVNHGACNRPIYCYTCAKRRQRERTEDWYHKIRDFTGIWKTVYIETTADIDPKHLRELLTGCNDMYKRLESTKFGIFSSHLFSNKDSLQKDIKLKPHIHGLLLLTEQPKRINNIKGLHIDYKDIQENLDPRAPRGQNLKNWLHYMFKYPIDEYNQNRKAPIIDKRYRKLIKSYLEIAKNPIQYFP
jgi:hypothetical protein